MSLKTGCPTRASGQSVDSLRVAMVASRFAPQLGGTEVHVSEVAQRIARRGVDVTVLTTDVSGRLPPVEQRGELVVRRFPARPRSTDLYASPGLAREVTQGGYELVHVQGVHTLVPPMALAVAQRARIPTVVTFHTGGHSSRLRRTIRGLNGRHSDHFSVDRRHSSRCAPTRLSCSLAASGWTRRSFA